MPLPSALVISLVGDTPGDAYVNSFTFDVVDQGQSVLFNIKNSGDAAAPSMFISKVFFDDKNSFFDDDTYLSSPLVNIGNVGQVGFNGGVSKDQLPQGGNGFDTDYVSHVTLVRVMNLVSKLAKVWD